MSKPISLNEVSKGASLDYVISRQSVSKSAHRTRLMTGVIVSEESLDLGRNESAFHASGTGSVRTCTLGDCRNASWKSTT
jgi:hypothetical protein